MKNNEMMKKMENGEKVIRMLYHVTIGLQYWSRKCTPSWASDDEKEYTEVTEISEETSDEAERPLTVISNSHWTGFKFVCLIRL